MRIGRGRKRRKIVSRAKTMNDDLWHFDGATYHLVNPELVSYPRSHRIEVDGRMVIEDLPPLEFTIVTAWPVAPAP